MKIKKWLKVSMIILCVLFFITGLYLVYNNVIRPIDIEGVSVKALEVREMYRDGLNEELKDGNYLVYKKTGFREIKESDIGDYIDLAVYFEFKSNSLIRQYDIHGDICNGEDIDCVLMQEKNLFVENIESKAKDTICIASIIIDGKGKTEKEIKKEVDKIELELFWSNEYFGDHSYKICLGDYDYTIENVENN